LIIACPAEKFAVVPSDKVILDKELLAKVILNLFSTDFICSGLTIKLSVLVKLLKSIADTFLYSTSNS
jgi:hypothetical protein